MDWPIATDFQEAIQNPSFCFEDQELKTGVPKLDVIGLPAVISGRFACVFQVKCKRKRYAVRCFTSHFADQEERYQIISSYLQKYRLKYFVDFQFIPRGIRIRGKWYPILKMEWTEGVSLTQYIEANLTNPRAIHDIADKFFDMLTALRQHSIAHADLQHGNILIANSELKLVDYDGMFVPGLENKLSHEVGQANYQHPGRTNKTFNKDLDNFSGWLIYTSLLAISLDPTLWSRLQGGDERLLLSENDLKDPFQSRAFREIEALSDPALHDSICRIKSFVFVDISQIPAPVKCSPSNSTGSSSSTRSTTWPPPYQQNKQPQQEPDNAEWIAQSIKPLHFESPCTSERIVLFEVTSAWILMVVVGGLMSILGVSFMAGLLAGGPIFIFMYLRIKYRKLPEITPLLEFKRTISQLRTDLYLQEKEYRQLSNRLNSLSREEERKFKKIEKKGKLLVEQEKKEVDAVSNRMNQDLKRVTRDRQKITQQRDSEIMREFKIRQNQYLTTGLSNARLTEGSISGIGPNLLATLRVNGVYSAADINNRISNIPGFGPNRVVSLFAFRKMVTRRLESSMPKTLSRHELDTINQKYSPQLTSLNQQEQTIRARAQRDNIAINGRYRQEHDKFNQETNKVKMQYENNRNSLEVSLKTDKEKVDGLMKELQYREKYRTVYRNITFPKYVERVVFLKR